MVISQKKLLSASIVVFLILRILTDGLYSHEKPAAVVIILSLFTLILSALLIMNSKSKKAYLILSIIFLLCSSLMVSSLYNSVPMSGNLDFVLKTLFPCMFLVASTAAPTIMCQTASTFRKYFFIPSFLFMIAVAVYSYKTNSGGVSFYDYYQNAPNHVVAQTILKISLPVISSGGLWVAFPLLLMLMLNVRSVFLAYTLSLAFSYMGQITNKRFVKKALLLIAIFGVAIFLFVDWTEVINRFLFKGRELDSNHALENFSSGRTSIYNFYISYIFDNFTWINWLFGNGPIWSKDTGPTLGPHNDILTMIVSSGLLGLFAVTYSYYYFYKSLPEKSRIIFLISFGILFLTNGVLFHQSNVLFSLLYIYNRPHST